MRAVSPTNIVRGVATVLLLLAFLFTYRHGESVSDARWQAKEAATKAAYDRQLADREAQARTVEQEAVARVNDIEKKRHDEAEAAQAAYDRLLEDYRHGAVRLRDRFTCPAAASVPAAASGTAGSQPAQGGGLQPEDVRFLVSEAKRADEVTRQLSACQVILQADRDTVNAPRIDSGAVR